MDAWNTGWLVVSWIIFSNVNVVQNKEDLTWATQISSYIDPIPAAVSRVCDEHIREYLAEAENLSTWAVSMMDASAKWPSGILSGNIRSMGNFDQCLEIKHPLQNFEGKYCSLQLHYSTFGKNRTILQKFINLVTAGRRQLELGNDWTNGTHILPTFSQSEWAVCVPSSCTAEDVRISMDAAIKRVTLDTGVSVSVTLDDSYCYTASQRKSFDLMDYITIFIFTVLILVITISTVTCHLTTVERKEWRLLKDLSSFSLIENWKELVAIRAPPNDAITCLEGIRSLSTIWVVMTHQIILISQLPYINKLEAMKTQNYYIYYALWNSYFNVDTFLFVSGLLRSYNLMKEFTKGQINVVTSCIQRYLRLTPAYLAVILFYVTFFDHLDNGPAWKYYVGRNSEACRKYWWQNLLYINNYASHNDKCLLQSWYLSSDMQLFLAAPLLVFPMKKWPSIGKTIMAIALFISVALPFTTTLINRLPGTYVFSIENSILNKYAHHVYMATHNRMSPYFVGLFLGYILYRSEAAAMTKWKVTFGWTTSLAIMYACVYGSKDMTSIAHSYNLWEAVAYGGFHRFSWAVSLAWLVYACHTGYGGLVNRFLSCNVFRFLGRLSYCVYLTHLAVLLYNAAVLQVPRQLHTYISIRDFFGDFIFIFILSTALYICVESPFYNSFYTTFFINAITLCSPELLEMERNVSCNN